MSDSILSAVDSNGVDVTAVSHLRRSDPTHLRTALMARDQRCVAGAAMCAGRLKIDHIVAVGAGASPHVESLPSLSPAPLPQGPSRVCARGRSGEVAVWSPGHLSGAVRVPSFRGSDGTPWPQPRPGQ